MEALQEEHLQDNAATVGSYFKEQLQIMQKVMSTSSSGVLNLLSAAQRGE